MSWHLFKVVSNGPHELIEFVNQWSDPRAQSLYDNDNRAEGYVCAYSKPYEHFIIYSETTHKPKFFLVPA